MKVCFLVLVMHWAKTYHIVFLVQLNVDDVKCGATCERRNASANSRYVILQKETLLSIV